MKKSYSFACISILFWSTLAVTAKLLLESVNNIQLLCLSSLFGGLVLLVVNIVTGKIKKLKSFRLKDYCVISLIGLPGTFLYYIFYYAGAVLCLLVQYPMAYLPPLIKKRITINVFR